MICFLMNFFLVKFYSSVILLYCPVQKGFNVLFYF